MLLLEEVARRIKDLEAVVCGGDVTALTLDTLDRISKVLKVKEVSKKEKVGPFPTEWKIFVDTKYRGRVYGYGSDKGMIRVDCKQTNPFDGDVSAFEGDDLDAMEVLLEDGNRLLLAALIS